MKKLFQAVFWSAYPAISAVPLAHFAAVTVPPELINPADNFAVFMTWWLVLAGLSCIATSTPPRSKKDEVKLLTHQSTFLNTYYGPAAANLVTVMYVMLGNWWMAAGVFFYLMSQAAYKQAAKDTKAAQ